MQVEWFNAKNNVELIRKSMASVGVEDVNNFSLFQTSDSANLNPKITRLLGSLHIGCYNHGSSEACEDMEKIIPSLEDAIDTTQAMCRKVKK